MHFPSVIVLVFVALHNTQSNILIQLPEACDGGICVPKHLCSTRRANDAPALARNDLITLQVDEDNECGDFMKICCKVSHIISTPANVTVPEADQKCGISNPQGLVYNVESNFAYAKYAEFPWIVAIFRNSASSGYRKLIYVGGGTLIHPKFVLTAAHTLKKPHGYVARFGEWNIDSDAEIYPTQDIEIQERILHPSYLDIAPPGNDIAVAVLKEKVIYSEHIRPLCLPSVLDMFVGHRCIATGWGLDEQTGHPTSIMKRVELKLLARSSCSRLFWKTPFAPFMSHSNFMCSETAEHQNACIKDGGTPLACQRDDGTYVLAGVASWAAYCGGRNNPGAYVDVAKHAWWLHDTIVRYDESSGEAEWTLKYLFRMQ